MDDVEVKAIEELVEQRNVPELLSYLVSHEPAASVRLVQLSTGPNEANATVLTAYYSAFLWSLIHEREVTELKNVLSKLSDSKLVASRTIKFSIDAAIAYLDLDLPALYALQTQMEDAKSVAPLVESTIVEIQRWAYLFAEQTYRAIKPQVLRYFLGLNDTTDEQLLEKVNSQKEGWKLENGLFIPPAKTETPAAESSSRSEEEKEAKIERLVKLATLLEQQSYLK